jgi:hypothetical protein
MLAVVNITPSFHTHEKEAPPPPLYVVPSGTGGYGSKKKGATKVRVHVIAGCSGEYM